MDELHKKLTQLTDLLKAIKAIKPATKGPSLPTIPAIKPPAPPSMAARPAASNKMPGVNPNTKKDPKKIAQQIKDGSMSTKTQKVMLKFEGNGQWKLEPTDPSSV